jgi:hypothetical protein
VSEAKSDEESFSDNVVRRRGDKNFSGKEEMGDVSATKKSGKAMVKNLSACNNLF